jgi:hypothetical protein
VTFLDEEPLVAERGSGFYRLIPHDDFRPGTPHQPSNLAEVGGKLQMLAVDGHDNIDLSGSQMDQGPYHVRWVDIKHPEDHGSDGSGVFQQGLDKGGAIFQRLEGAWYGNGVVYFISTSGGGTEITFAITGPWKHGIL